MERLRYDNLGNTIQIHLKDEFYIVCFISKISNNSYRCDMNIRDKDSGFIMELDKYFIIASEPQNVKIKITEQITRLILEGYFTDDITNMNNVYDCLYEKYLCKKGI